MTGPEGLPVSPLEGLADVASSIATNGGPSFAEAGDILDEGRSSSLSELEDAADEVDMVSANSVISKQLEADSEAETERLANTPQKLQKNTDVELGRIPFVASPSKLANAILPTEDDAQSDSVVSSPGPSDDEMDSETRSVHSAVSKTEDHIMPSAESSHRKRKHSDVEDETGSEDDQEDARRQRRRTESIVTDVDDRSEIGGSREPTVEPMRGPADEIEEASNMHPNGAKILPTKSKTKKAKGKVRETLNNILEEDETRDGQARTNGTHPVSEDEEQAAQDDEDADATARDEEELAKKAAAMEALAHVEKRFAIYRDRIYDDLISGINEEIAQLKAPGSTHPELSRQIEVVKQYRNEKMEIEQDRFAYRVIALKKTSVAHRAQIQSSYYQTARDVRENHQEKLGECLSRLRRDHIKGNEQIPSYTIPFPTDRLTQVTQQVAYNKEVSLLSGIAKHVGFPAAPPLSGATRQELEEDLAKMGNSVAKNQRLLQPGLNRNNFVAMSRPAAEEQFLEQNAWANPRHPSHTQNTGQLSRQMSIHERPKDTIMTPAPLRNAADQARPVGSASNIPEMTSAQPSSAITLPYPEAEAPGQRPFDIINNQDGVSALDRSHIQQDRQQSVSPSENRRHANILAGPTRAVRPVTGLAEAEDRLPSEYLGPLRGGLFRTSSGSDLMAREQGAHLIDTGRLNSSPLSLHQHSKESTLTSIAGLSKIGAR